MRVNILEFEDLALSDRLDLLEAVGTLVSRVNMINQLYVLYSLYDYYVELVICYNGNQTKVSQAVAFRDCNRLNKHLKEIDLSELQLK